VRRVTDQRDAVARPAHLLGPVEEAPEEALPDRRQQGRDRRRPAAEGGAKLVRVARRGPALFGLYALSPFRNLLASPVPCIAVSHIESWCKLRRCIQTPWYDTLYHT
jgi:hypothetical protein